MTSNNQNENPPLVDVYGTRPPRASVFRQGARDIAEVQDATDKRRQAPIGGYDRAAES